MNEKENSIVNKSNIWDCASAIISLLAVALSIFSVWQSKKLLDYQISQEILPGIICADSHFSASIKRNFYDGIENYESADDMFLPIYNIGVGTALNCKLEWNIESIKNACIQSKDMLKYPVSFGSFNKENRSEHYFSSYTYSYEYVGDSLNSISYYDKGNLCEKDFNFEATEIPYILPLTEKDSENYIKIPETIAILILGLGNQKNTSTISFDLDVSYQDINGLDIFKKFEVDVTLINTTEEADQIHCDYRIEVQEKKIS